LFFLSFLFLALCGVGIYLQNNDKIFNFKNFDKHLGLFQEEGSSDSMYYVLKAMGMLAILLSTVPTVFTNVIDLLVIKHAEFIE